MSTSQTILFLGATGGVCGAALQLALSAGINCVALVRTPAKLTDKYPSKPNLTVVQGDSRNIADVKRALSKPSDVASSGLVDIVVSSVGSYPSMRNFGANEDPTLCEESMKALLSAVEELIAQGGVQKLSPPRIIAVSSTGISDFGRDVPLALAPLYYLLLASAHKDKRKMESQLITDKATGKKAPPAAGSARPEFTVVRGSMYVESKDGGKAKPVRVGVEDPYKGIESQAIGYTIAREDVGKWIFHNLISDATGAKRYINKMVTVTY
ncbi:uncharacterized protein PpBr36_10577 [Pyricularia pennisetigena]|uniref:uncharacterized protein n=1 Tax=Pyricularia pennisetigena TaxID=1578925 RepID=UPI0011510F05|nr:uncharacterized protein PpBr36_10577 [Pyricularia pennisetigena]TLS21103.1 hypothetical protein PpBr36_10577 [Pyricularia pennisetigena]